MGQRKGNKALEVLAQLKHRLPQTIWFADLDDTLVNTVSAHAAAATSIQLTLNCMVGEERAQTITRRFVDIFGLLIIGHHRRTADDWTTEDPETRKRYDAVFARVADYQRELQERYAGVKMFSREVLLKIASDDEGASLSSDQLSACTDEYWNYMSAHIEFFDYAVEMTQRIADHNRPLYIFTSSDARLILRGNGQFAYDPEASRQLKANRLEALKARGLQFSRFFIGDPVDKPTPEFYDAIYAGVADELGEQPDPGNFVVMGDSVSADLDVPLVRWGAGLGVWFRHGQKTIRREGDHLISIGSWRVVADVLKVPPVESPTG